MTEKEKRHFLSIFSWYRGISLGIVSEVSLDVLDKKLTPHSLTLYCQLVDLGDMQLRVLGKLVGRELRTEKAENLLAGTHAKKTLKSYLLRCQKTFEETLLSEDLSGKTLDWYGRFSFDATGTLNFLLAHESLHHGEILSLIYSLSVPMPKAFQDSWGMC